MSPDPIAAATRRWIGTPYRHLAAVHGAGCDCLGLVRGVWRDLYGTEPLEVPPYRADWRDRKYADELQAAAGRLFIATVTGPRMGQVMLFRLGPARLPRHCGIAVSETRFVHAQEGLGVVEANLTEAWRRRIAALFEFPEQ